MAREKLLTSLETRYTMASERTAPHARTLGLLSSNTPAPADDALAAILF